MEQILEDDLKGIIAQKNQQQLSKKNDITLRVGQIPTMRKEKDFVKGQLRKSHIKGLVLKAQFICDSLSDSEILPTSRNVEQIENKEKESLHNKENFLNDISQCMSTKSLKTGVNMGHDLPPVKSSVKSKQLKSMQVMAEVQYQQDYRLQMLGNRFKAVNKSTERAKRSVSLQKFAQIEKNSKLFGNKAQLNEKPNSTRALSELCVKPKLYAKDNSQAIRNSANLTEQKIGNEDDIVIQLGLGISVLNNDYYTADEEIKLPKIKMKKNPSKIRNLDHFKKPTVYCPEINENETVFCPEVGQFQTSAKKSHNQLKQFLKSKKILNVEHPETVSISESGYLTRQAAFHSKSRRDILQQQSRQISFTPLDDSLKHVKIQYQS